MTSMNYTSASSPQTLGKTYPFDNIIIQHRPNRTIRQTLEPIPKETRISQPDPEADNSGIVPHVRLGRLRDLLGSLEGMARGVDDGVVLALGDTECEEEGSNVDYGSARPLKRKEWSLP
jgi:hypothetical protein